MTVEGELFSRSSAALHVMKRLGAVWLMVVVIGQLVPVAWRDGVYDAVAWSSYHLFRKPESACPLLSGHLRSRFE
jgi:predicted DCC family thiol-disulfide oxidoreductase YuxK